MKAGKTGVTVNTPKNVFFGAGTIHKGLTYTGSTSGSWNFDASIIGATSGGSKLSIVPEIYPIPADGALVDVKGLDVKVGESAQMEVNFIELTEDMIKAATLGTSGTGQDATHYNLIESKANIVTGDYWENIAFVGKNLEGKNIIAILPNVICISGFDNEGKNKEGNVIKLVFKCTAELSSELDTLPWKIYYPKST